MQWATQAGGQSDEALAASTQTASEAFQAIRTVQAYGMESSVVQVYHTCVAASGTPHALLHALLLATASAPSHRNSSVQLKADGRLAGAHSFIHLLLQTQAMAW